MKDVQNQADTPKLPIDKIDFKNSMETRTTPGLFVAKSYTIIIALNVVIKILWILFMADYFENEPARQQIRPLFYVLFGEILFGLVSSIVLLFMGTKYTNIKVLRRCAQIYFSVYLALFASFAVLVFMIKLSVSAVWGLAASMLTVVCCFAILILPFVMLYIALQHTKLFIRLYKAAKKYFDI